ncbi:MAG: hypothetical protein ACI841_004379 [Planctomycetota bacterium]|jgi:hypothetical protein
MDLNGSRIIHEADSSAALDEDWLTCLRSVFLAQTRNPWKVPGQGATTSSSTSIQSGVTTGGDTLWSSNSAASQNLGELLESAIQRNPNGTLRALGDGFVLETDQAPERDDLARRFGQLVEGRFDALDLFL